MKTKIKRHSRSVISVVLALCLFVSCMTVGMIMTDAAKTDSEAVAATVDSEEVGLDSGDGIHLGIGTTTTTWHGMGSNAYEFTLAATTTIYYTFSVGGGNYGKGNQGNPAANSLESYTYYAIKDNYTQYSISLPAGTYKFKIKGYQGNNRNTLEYQFWVVSSGGGGDGGDTTEPTMKIYGRYNGAKSWSTAGSPMTYIKTENSYYYYRTTLNAGQHYFKFITPYNKDGGTTDKYWTAPQESDDYTVPSEESSASGTLRRDSDANAAFYLKNDGAYFVWAKARTSMQDNDNDVKVWVTPATYPTAASLSISASPTELTAVDQTSTITVTATDIAGGLTNLTYTIYDRANNEVVGSPVTVTNGATYATFTVTPDDRVKSYYASVKPTDSAQQALYDEVWTSTDATISNSADAYIPRYTVTFSSNNDTYGTVTAKDASGNDITSGDSVKEGDSITFTATAKTGNVFVDWSEFDTKSSAVTRVIRANTTATGNFGPKGYSIFYQTDSTGAMTEKSNGWYVSPKLPKGYTFTIKQNFSGKYLNAGGDNGYYEWKTEWMGPDHCDGISDTDWESTKFTSPNSKFYKNDTGKDVYCVYDPSTNRVWVTEDPDGLYGVHVVAKDGTIRYGHKTTADYTQVFGDTTVELVSPSSITGTVDNNAYDGMAVAYNLSADDVRNGVTLKIKTQTKSDYVNQGYYVKGFVVSGYEESFSVLWQEFVGGEKGAAEKATYDDRTWIHSGYNEFELTIDGYPEKNIEITPVYEKREKTYGDNIRFYVEGFAGEVYKEWGGTLAIDAYSTETDRMFGEYPGQPMINYNGRYVVDLPRTGITGITLNNYVWDRVHSNLFYGTTGTAADDTFNNTVKANNYQTYDFNDFIYLKQVMDDANDDEDIVFSFRHRTSDDHDTKDDSQLGKSTYYENSPGSSAATENDYRKKFNTINPDDSIYQWENLTDFYGNRVDIFGDIVDIKDSSGTVTNPKAAYTNPIRIVSNGYDYNKAGNYATAWALYEPVDANNQPAYTGTVDHYQLIEVFGGQGIVNNTDYSQRYDSSSYLVNPTWTINLRDKYDDAYAHDTSKTHYGATYRFDLTRVPTVISYEYQVKDGYSNLNLENRNDGGEPAYRSDGRWFTTSSNQFLTAHTVIEYAEKDEESLYQRDFYQGNGIDYTSATGYNPTKNTGLATGIQAYFENSDSDDGTDTGTAYTNTSGNTEAYAVSDGEHVFKLKAVDDPNGDYVFKGWYLYTNGKYSLVTRNQTYDSEATANDVYVARYYKAPSGTLNITHELTSASKGEASCLAKVEVLDSNNAVVATIKDFTTDAIKVTPTYMKNTSDNKLRITLKTSLVGITEYEWTKEDIDGDNTLAALAVGGKIASVSAVTTSGNDREITITTTPISSFFTNGEQNVKLLPFYSQTKYPTINYEITYNYKSRKTIVDGALSNLDTNRLWGDQFYKAVGTFTDEQIEEYINLVGPAFKEGKDKEFVQDNTPYEENFKEKLTWDYSGVSFATPTKVNDAYTFTTSMTAQQDTNEDIDVTLKFPFAYTFNATELDKTDDTEYTFTPTQTDGKVIYVDETQDKTVGMKFLDWFSLNKIHNIADMNNYNGAEPTLIEAPAVVYNGKSGDAERKRTFKWWELRTQGTNGSDGYVYKKVYSTILNVPFYQDTVLVPVYSDEVTVDTEQQPVVKPTTDKTATITWLQNSRSQWNYEGGGSASKDYGVYDNYGDRLFSDFVLTYEYNNIKLNSVKTPANYEVGILFEKLDDAYTTAVPTLMETYKNNDGKSAAEAELKKDAVDSKYTKSTFDVTKLDNKNSIEYYYSFANKNQNAANTANDTTTFTARRDNAYRAYSFIKVGSDVIVSDPVYFTYNDVAFIQNGDDAVIN